MKMIVTIGTGAVLGCLSILGLAQENADPAAMQAAMMKHMMPGEYHSIMAKMEGDWTFESSIWMNPSGPPMKSNGTATYTMIFGGRFLEQDFRGQLMGMEIQGRGVWAYDNTREIFMSTWIDSLGTSIAHGEGSYDSEKKIIHIQGKMTNGMTGKSEPFRYTIEMKNDDNMVFTMYSSLKGQELKVMEIMYKRTK